ncbi:hypothetical protein D3C87_1434340 [compost metagenome]
MAMPTSAAASAGASLMPSPILATVKPDLFNSPTMRCLSSGRSSARTSMPNCRPIASAVRRLSPVRMTTWMPASVSALTPAAASGRGSSRMAIAPTISLSATSTETVLPSSFSAAMRAVCSGDIGTRSLAALGEPRNTVTVPTIPSRPLPPMAFTAAMPGTGDSNSPARCRIARASGWLDPCSSAAAKPSTSFSSRPKPTISVTRGLPSVSVPVLSKAAAVILPTFSRTAPPFKSRPRRAPAERLAAIAAGVEITNAQGQPINRIASPL